MADKSGQLEFKKIAEIMAAYDELPYHGSPQPELDLNHISSLAKLFGLKPAPINGCRYLALGCGDGAQMVPMALNFPDSDFTGVDLSKNEIARANQQINALKLKNIKISHCDILDVNKDFGKFDYILAHGVYSWVPDNVRKKVLSIFQQNLSSDGIGIITYNTYPGWHIQQMIRQMLLYHIGDINNTAKKIAEARKFLLLLAETSPHETVYGQCLREMNRQVEAYSDNFFRHDLLGDINQPFYFHEFINAIQFYDLQYITEAEYHSVVLENYSMTVQDSLNKLRGNYIYKQQHLDYVQGRSFRQSLICHQDKIVRHDIDLNALEQMYFSANVRPVSLDMDVNSTEKAEFYAKDKVMLNTFDPLTKVLWKCFSDSWPKPQPFEHFLNNAETLLERKTPKMKGYVLSALLKNVQLGFVFLATDPVLINQKIVKHPKVNKLVRYQAASQLWVTNQFQQKIQIDAFNHHVLPLLDGHNDASAIIDKLYQLVLYGKINLSKAGMNVVDEREIKNILKDKLDASLKLYLKNGLLI